MRTLTNDAASKAWDALTANWQEAATLLIAFLVPWILFS